MEALKSSFLYPIAAAPAGGGGGINPTLKIPSSSKPPPSNTHKSRPNATTFCCRCSVTPDPWTLSDGNKPKPKSKNPKNRLSDDNARRIIKAKAQYLSQLRRNQGSRAQTPKWIKRTPEQMVQYLEDDRNGHLYGKHVVAAIKRVRSLSGKPEGSYDMREVMGSFVAKLTFREMCVVLKEQKGWRQVRDFFAWMKLQLSYRPSVIAYTIVLRAYGQVGKIKLAEQVFLEMLEAGCEPDEVASGTMLCAYARWGRHKAMLSFYSAVRDRGITPPTAVFNFMLSSLQKKLLHEHVLNVWRQMMDDKVVPDHFTYTVVISSFVKVGLAEDAFRTFAEMNNMGYVPEEATYSLLIALSAKSGSCTESFKLYEDMRSRGIVPSNFTCASLLALYYKIGDYSKALSLFSEMERYGIVADEVIYGLLIRIYGKLGLYEDAQKTFEEVEKLGLLSDQKTYTTMAQVHLNFGSFDKALSLMEKMKSANILSSRFALIVLLQCHVKKEDLESAETTFQALSKTGPPDTGSCNCMLNLFMKLDLMERAKHFAMKIRKDQVEFDMELLKTVMKVYCKEGMITDAKNLIDDLCRTKMSLDCTFVQTFLVALYGSRPAEAEFFSEPFDNSDPLALELILTLLVSNQHAAGLEGNFKLFLESANGLLVASQLIIKFCKQGNVAKAEYLFELLIKMGNKPKDAASGSLISLYGKQQKLKQAEKVFATVANSSETRGMLHSSMIDAYSKCDKHEEAYMFYKEETRQGNNFGPVAISMLVNALANRGKFREAEDVVHNSLRSALGLDTVAYNTFIKAMLEAGKLRFAASIYDRMLSLNVAPSLQTYNTMISVYGRGRNLDKAVKMFDMARSRGMSLDEKTYTNIICYLGKADRTQEASLLFNKMQEEGIKPGKVSYNVMMNIYAAAGLYNEAEELFCSMKRDGCLPDSYTHLALIRAYTQGLKYSEGEKVIILMQKEGLCASCAHLNLLLLAFAKAGLTEEAERFYGKFLTFGLTPDIESNRIMLRGYLDYGHIEKGISFFERISESVEPDRFIMSAAIHFYMSAGLEHSAEELLRSMSSLGIPFLENLVVGSRTKANPSNGTGE
ncbi:pentatricopeptide repeat-containing protein At5g27270 isoform X2 [Coffea eugenioides]|uniref:pentatricopeptide repeat-containing protein At5g27270 isoform X2 n=1 Tax=Coffea eugenioides TaxID=49369 RepID=UPI000F60B2C0|nr:pentatricopeptide repeat-containing protein At5g27270 isoform X2 [Coffea eugenioides]